MEYHIRCPGCFHTVGHALWQGYLTSICTQLQSHSSSRGRWPASTLTEANPFTHPLFHCALWRVLWSSTEVGCSWATAMSHVEGITRVRTGQHIAMTCTRRGQLQCASDLEITCVGKIKMSWRREGAPSANGTEHVWRQCAVHTHVGALR